MRGRVAPLLLALASCGSGEEPERVRVALLPYTSYALLIVAQDSGDFADQGLEVEFVRMPSSEGAVPLLARGDLDVLPAFLGPGLLNAIARGGDLRIVAAQARLKPDGCPYMALIARENLLKDGSLAVPIAGEPLMVSAELATVDEYLVEQALAAVGIGPAAFRIERLPDEAAGAALDAGAVDLALMGEPWLARHLESRPHSLWRMAGEVAPGLQISAVAFGPRLLEQDPGIGVRFLAGYLSGARRFAEGKTPGNMAAIAALTGLDPELIEATCWPAIPADGRVDTTSVQAFQRWAAGKGYLDRVLDVERWWDPSFLERADSESPSPMGGHNPAGGSR